MKSFIISVLILIAFPIVVLGLAIYGYMTIIEHLCGDKLDNRGKIFMKCLGRSIVNFYKQFFKKETN